jgi:hypothetical protein
MTPEQKKNTRSAQLDEHQRKRLVMLADLIAPRLEDMPSASDLGLVDGGIKDVLSLRPDLADKLPDILSNCPDTPSNHYLEDLGTDQPEALEVLLHVIAGAYYMHPRVRKLIGYDGQKELSIEISPVSSHRKPSV